MSGPLPRTGRLLPPDAAPGCSGGAARSGRSRRRLLGAAAAAPLLLTLRPSPAADDQLDAAVRAFAGEAPIRDGRVTLEIAPLVENGNTVPVVLRADSPMTESDHVTALALFNQRNPLRDVAVFQLSPSNGRAQVATRIRLATSQDLAAVAKMSDGSVWQQRVSVLVTLAACIE
jgi:sulfur-oxidizing protein SoxY